MSKGTQLRIPSSISGIVSEWHLCHCSFICICQLQASSVVKSTLHCEAQKQTENPPHKCLKKLQIFIWNYNLGSISSKQFNIVYWRIKIMVLNSRVTTHPRFPRMVLVYTSGCSTIIYSIHTLPKAWKYCYKLDGPLCMDQIDGHPNSTSDWSDNFKAV